MDETTIRIIPFTGVGEKMTYSFEKIHGNSWNKRISVPANKC